MTQAQLDAKSFKLKDEDFESVIYNSKRKSITCALSQNVSLILKRTRYGLAVIIVKGTKRVFLPIKLFDFICDSKLSIAYLCSFLEQSDEVI